MQDKKAVWYMVNQFKTLTLFGDARCSINNSWTIYPTLACVLTRSDATSCTYWMCCLNQILRAEPSELASSTMRQAMQQWQRRLLASRLLSGWLSLLLAMSTLATHPASKPPASSSSSWYKPWNRRMLRWTRQTLWHTSSHA